VLLAVLLAGASSRAMLASARSLLTDLLILHAVLLLLVLLVHAVINYTAIYDVITDVCLLC